MRLNFLHDALRKHKESPHISSNQFHSPSLDYNLHFGANLISFPSQDPVDVGAAIPDDVEDKFLSLKHFFTIPCDILNPFLMFVFI